MGSHLCTNLVIIGISFLFFKILCDSIGDSLEFYFLIIRTNYYLWFDNGYTSFSMTLCIKAVMNMEDKCLLNLDKFYL